MFKKLFTFSWVAIKIVVGFFVLLFFYLLASFSGLFSNPASNTKPTSNATVQMILPAPPPPLSKQCEPNNFNVKIDRINREHNSAVFIGSLVNTSPIACGVQLKAATFNKAGSVIDVYDFWPASIRNIQPGATEQFKFHMPHNSLAKDYELKPINTKIW